VPRSTLVPPNVADDGWSDIRRADRVQVRQQSRGRPRPGTRYAAVRRSPSRRDVLDDVEVDEGGNFDVLYSMICTKPMAAPSLVVRIAALHRLRNDAPESATCS
jgi:hypothetical protein